METAEVKKEITLDDLALMVGQGFNGVNERLDHVETRLSNVETRLNTLETRLDTVENRLGTVEHSMESLRSSINNYLELSDKRYLELKARQNIIVNWIKQIGDKTGVRINLEDLEKIV